MADPSEFLNPRSRYYGQVKPENLVFNANLQEFANRVSLICSLETNGKLTPEESYKQIKSMFKQLKQSKKQLGIGHKPFQSDSD
jgi:isopropylmalate/homocitrate/citramalate synthase